MAVRGYEPGEKDRTLLNHLRGKQNVVAEKVAVQAPDLKDTDQAQSQLKLKRNEKTHQASKAVEEKGSASPERGNQETVSKQRDTSPNRKKPVQLEPFPVKDRSDKQKPENQIKPEKTSERTFRPKRGRGR